jgi:hypothetical protein
VGTAWVWSPGWPTETGIFQRVRLDRRTTFDSGATPQPGQVRAAPRTLAEVDLKALRSRLDATVERAKADDPRELRRHIADLEHALRTRPAAVRTEIVVERVEVPAVDAKTLEQLEGMVAVLKDTGAELVGLGDRLVAGLARVRNGQAPTHEAPGRAPEPRTPRRADVRRAPLQPPAGAPVTPNGLSAPQQRILDALAAFAAVGLDLVAKSNVATWAGQSPSSSGFANNLGALRSRGLIVYPTGGRVALTEAGRALATATEPITSLDQLHAAWLGRLPGPPGRLLRVLIDRYPRPMERAELAEAAGQSPTSRGFANNLGARRSLGLIDYPQRGQVVATGLLFPELPGRRPRHPR